MGTQNQIINRLQRQRQSTDRMLAPGSKEISVSQPVGNQLARFTRLSGSRLSAAARMRYVDAHKLGAVYPHSLGKFARSFPQKFHHVRKLIHYSPSFSRDPSIWSELDRTLPTGQSDRVEGPSQPGELGPGSIIPRMSPPAQAGQSLSPVKGQAQPRPRPSKRQPHPKPKLAPKSRIYAQVQEISGQDQSRGLPSSEKFEPPAEKPATSLSSIGDETIQPQAEPPRSPQRAAPEKVTDRSAEGDPEKQRTIQALPIATPAKVPVQPPPEPSTSDIKDEISPVPSPSPRLPIAEETPFLQQRAEHKPAIAKPVSKKQTGPTLLKAKPVLPKSREVPKAPAHSDRSEVVRRESGLPQNRAATETISHAIPPSPRTPGAQTPGEPVSETGGWIHPAVTQPPAVEDSSKPGREATSIPKERKGEEQPSEIPVPTQASPTPASTFQPERPIESLAVQDESPKASTPVTNLLKKIETRKQAGQALKTLKPDMVVPPALPHRVAFSPLGTIQSPASQVGKLTAPQPRSQPPSSEAAGFQGLPNQIPLQYPSPDIQRHLTTPSQTEAAPSTFNTPIPMSLAYGPAPAQAARISAAQAQGSQPTWQSPGASSDSPPVDLPASSKIITTTGSTEVQRLADEQPLKQGREIVRREIEEQDELSYEPEETDLNQLAEEVLPLVKRILEIEAERLSR